MLMDLFQKNGFRFRYNRATNEVATAKPNCTMETFFKSEKGKDYWMDQISKYRT